MPTLRDIRNRISGVRKTQKITRAMYLVSAAKMARSHSAIVRARPYAEKLSAVMGAVSAGVETDTNPLLAERERIRRLDLVVFASNRGLCGAYNANVIKRARRLIEERRDELESVSIIPVGARVDEYFGRHRLGEIPRAWNGIASVSSHDAHEIAGYLTGRYLEGESDEVCLVYSTFVSALTQTPGVQRLIPLSQEAVGEPLSYEVEPGPAELLDLLVPQAIEFGVYRALLENQAGEHAARMTAMDSATKNTEELEQTLTIDFNKARQASITAELVEIVSGAEAL